MSAGPQIFDQPIFPECASAEKENGCGDWTTTDNKRSSDDLPIVKEFVETHLTWAHKGQGNSAKAKRKAFLATQYRVWQAGATGGGDWPKVVKDFIDHFPMEDYPNPSKQRESLADTSKAITGGGCGGQLVTKVEAVNSALFNFVAMDFTDVFGPLFLKMFKAAGVKKQIENGVWCGGFIPGGKPWKDDPDQTADPIERLWRGYVLYIFGINGQRSTRFHKCVERVQRLAHRYFSAATAAREKFFLPFWNLKKDLVDPLSVMKMSISGGKFKMACAHTPGVDIGPSKMALDIYELAMPYSAADSPKETSRIVRSGFMNFWDTSANTLYMVLGSVWKSDLKSQKLLEFLSPWLMEAADGKGKAKAKAGGVAPGAKAKPAAVEALAPGTEEWFVAIIQAEAAAIFPVDDKSLIVEVPSDDDDDDDDGGVKRIPLLEYLRTVNPYEPEIYAAKATKALENARQKKLRAFYKWNMLYFIEQVFPNQLEQANVQVSSTAQTFETQPLFAMGFSGTEAGKADWNLRFIRDYDEDTGIRILNRFKQLEKKPETTGGGPFNRAFTGLDVELPATPFTLLKVLPESAKSGQRLSAFIDAGALFRELDLRVVACQLLRALVTLKFDTAKKYIVYMDTDDKTNQKSCAYQTFNHAGQTPEQANEQCKDPAVSKPTMISGTDAKVVLAALALASMEEMNLLVLNFYPQANIVGTDLYNTPGGRGFMTTSPALLLNKYLQATIRLRAFIEPSNSQWGPHGQQIDMLVDTKTTEVIRKTIYEDGRKEIANIAKENHIELPGVAGSKPSGKRESSQEQALTEDTGGAAAALAAAQAAKADKDKAAKEWAAAQAKAKQKIPGKLATGVAHHPPAAKDVPVEGVAANAASSMLSWEAFLQTKQSDGAEVSAGSSEKMEDEEDVEDDPARSLEDVGLEAQASAALQEDGDSSASSDEQQDWTDEDDHWSLEARGLEEDSSEEEEASSLQVVGRRHHEAQHRADPANQDGAIPGLSP